MTIPLPEGVPLSQEDRFQQTLLRFTHAGSEGRWELGPVEEGHHPRVTVVGPHGGRALTAGERADLAYLRGLVPVDVVPHPSPAPATRSI
jgi:hypothetical protein